MNIKLKIFGIIASERTCDWMPWSEHLRGTEKMRRIRYIYRLLIMTIKTKRKSQKVSAVRKNYVQMSSNCLPRNGCLC